MPIFEYICRECDHHFETIVLGSQKAACPKCESKRLEKQLSAFAVKAEKSQQAVSAPGPCGACGDPRGPGACGLN